MLGSATVSAELGPGLEASSLVMTKITNVELDLTHEVIRFKHGEGKVSEFSLVGVNTLTTTLTGVTKSPVTFVVVET